MPSLKSSPKFRMIKRRGGKPAAEAEAAAARCAPKVPGAAGGEGEGAFLRFFQPLPWQP